jgi:sulfite oxidase
MYHKYYKWFPKHITSVTKQEAEVMATPPVTELSTNAVAFQPRDGVRARKGPLTLSGYSYGGGGRAIARVEVSRDEGKTWCQATKTRSEPTDHGRSYAWTTWSCILET